MRGSLSGAIKRRIRPYGAPETVIITQRCRQLSGRLKERNARAEYIPLVDAVALEAGPRAIARLSLRGDVGAIEENGRVRALMDRARGTVGCIPRPEGATGRGVVIAILDTGIQPSAEFADRILAFRDIVGGKEDPYDDHGHGTMCAACAAGSGAQSLGRYQGMAPEAELVIVKTMDADGGGSTLDVLRGLQWVSDNRRALGIRVLSLSLGIEAQEESDALMRGVEALWSQGVVVVAAAGNSGPGEGTINSPGRAGSVLTVGAVDDRGRRPSIAEFSSRGPVRGTQKPELCAPGVRLRTVDNHGFGLFTGTSAATPVAAGAAALLLEKHPEWTPDRVKQEMMRKAKPVSMDMKEEGYGCLYLGGYGTPQPDAQTLFAGKSVRARRPDAAAAPAAKRWEDRAGEGRP